MQTPNHPWQTILELKKGAASSAPAINPLLISNPASLPTPIYFPLFCSLASQLIDTIFLALASLLSTLSVLRFGVRSISYEPMAAILRLRILAAAAAAAVVASSLVGTVSAADGPAPAPTSGANPATVPAFAVASLAAAAAGYLFC